MYLPLKQVLLHCWVDIQHKYQDMNKAAALRLLLLIETDGDEKLNC